MTTSDDSGDGLNTVESIITLIAAVIGFCLCCLFWLFLWRRNRQKMKNKVVTQLAGLENHPTRSTSFYSDRRDEADSSEPHWKFRDVTELGNNEHMERPIDDWRVRSFAGGQPRVMRFTEDEHFSDIWSPPYSQKHQNFIDRGIIHSHNSDGAESCAAEDILVSLMIKEDVTSSSTSDSNSNIYPDIVALNHGVSFKINENFIKKNTKLFDERPTASAAAVNDVGSSETTGTLGTFPSSMRAISKEDGVRFPHPPGLHISRSGSPMYEQRYENVIFDFESFSPMNRDHSFEIPERPQSRRSRKSEETEVTPQERDSERGSYLQKNPSWPSEETDNSRFTSQSVLRMRSQHSRTGGYSYNSKASCITLGSESLQRLNEWEDFSEDGQSLRPYDVPSNPQVRRANNREEAHNGRTSREPERSIVLGMAENGSRSRNRGAPTRPRRYSNGRSHPQVEKSIEKSSATSTVYLGLPPRFNRGGGTKVSKQQLSSEEEETLNQNPRAGGAGLRKREGNKRCSWLPSENEHKESLSQNANINPGQSTQTRVDRSVGTLESRQRPSSLQTAEEGVSEPSVHDSESLEKSPKRGMMPKKIEKEKGFR